MGDTNGILPGIHAELDALTKLKPLGQKRLENVELLVIRLSKTNNIQSSRPCNNCIELMNYLPEKKGYKIKTIYYLNNDGDIIKTDLQTLEKEEKHYSRFYRRNNKNKNS
jgi:cytidine deaminase